MLLHISVLLLIAFAATAVMPIVGVNGLLVARPCFIQGNPWRMLGTVKRKARPVAMTGENAGHNPFNTFPDMVQYGNCVKIYFSYESTAVNITIVCGPTHGKASQPRNGHDPVRTLPQCPVNTSDIKWPLANLVYLEYDVERFELTSCVTLNETHSYHGHLLLADDAEKRSYMLPSYLPMWHKKLQQPGMVLFEFNGNCSECNFRNEYIQLMPSSVQNEENTPVEPQTYCNEGNASESKIPNSHITMQVNVGMSEVMMKLFIPTVVIFIGVLLLRFCLCIKKSTSVMPEMAPNEKP